MQIIAFEVETLWRPWLPLSATAKLIGSLDDKKTLFSNHKTIDPLHINSYYY